MNTSRDASPAAATPPTAAPPAAAASPASTRLPGPVAAALAAPAPGRRREVYAAGITWSWLEWGEPADRPLLLLHGVTSSARTWWRVGPALAASGRRVVAPDLPGHGRTGSWLGRHRFRDTAADVADFARAAGLDRPGLEAVGHSWGAMIAAALPAVGLRPASLVLVDPPALPASAFAAMLDDPVEHPYDDPDEAVAAIAAVNPHWAPGDVAEGLVDLDPEAVRAVLCDNGDWDAGLGDLADRAAAGIPVLVVRGDPAAGGFIPDAALPPVEARVGVGRVLTLTGAPHSPHRTHPEALVTAVLRGLG